MHYVAYGVSPMIASCLDSVSWSLDVLSTQPTGLAMYRFILQYIVAIFVCVIFALDLFLVRHIYIFFLSDLYCSRLFVNDPTLIRIIFNLLVPKLNYFFFKSSSSDLFPQDVEIQQECCEISRDYEILREISLTFDR